MKKTKIDNDEIALSKVKKIYNELIESCSKSGYNIAEFKITGDEYDENIRNDAAREGVFIGLDEGEGYFIPLYDDIRKIYYLDIGGRGWKCILYIMPCTSTALEQLLLVMRGYYYEDIVKEFGKAAYKINKIDNEEHLKEYGYWIAGRYYIKDNEIRSIFGAKL